MTRSVELPEEAVLAATRALAEKFATNKPVNGSKDFAIDARAALLAALPYLAPAEIGGRTLCANCTACLSDCPDCAPAGDGGLREALEKKLATTDGWAVANETLLDLLKAHPAVPAVPQPAEVEYEDAEFETEADVERRNHWFRVAAELGQQDDFVEMLAHERRMPATRAERLTAQPVDREALERGVAAYIDEHGSGDEHPVDMIRDISDAIQAVLAGEQDQVEHQQ